MNIFNSLRNKYANWLDQLGIAMAEDLESLLYAQLGCPDSHTPTEDGNESKTVRFAHPDDGVPWLEVTAAFVYKPALVPSFWRVYLITELSFRKPSI